ncbi:MAG: hypothetical protein WC657_00475 [Candidatus Paceibacterota bacterium]|jgi:hypothetical protein
METFTPPPIYSEPNTEKKPKWIRYAVGILLIFVIFLIALYWFKYVNVFQQKIDAQESTYQLPITGQFTDWKTFQDKNFAYTIKYPTDWSINHGLITSPDNKASLNVATKSCDSYNSIGEFKESVENATTSMFYKDICSVGLSVRLSVYGDKGTLTEYQPTLEQILSTMKLNVDDSLWQTYENKNFLFKFKYPKDLKLKINENYSQVNIYVGDTNFYISASKTNQTLDSIKQTEENWQPLKFKNQDALILTLGGSYCDKELVFVDKGIKYQIMEPTSCSVPLDRRMSKIFETFQPIDLETETQVEVFNGKIYNDEQYGFEFKYPYEWTLKKGPITYDINPDMIVVRYALKNNASKQKCESDDGLFLCTNIKLANLNAYIFLDKGQEFGPRRILEQSRNYFQDYVDIVDKNGNKITIEFFSTAEKDESTRLIKSVLSTFKFTK